MDRPASVPNIGRLGQVAEQAGLSIEDVIRILGAGVSVERLLDLIERGDLPLPDGTPR
jgi:hypothetical protein